jgi:hypothetical protein
MFYFQCKRCEYISKQKIDMKRHLEKNKKCIIINNNKNKSEDQLYFESLIPSKIISGLDIEMKEKEKEKKFLCERCNLKCSTKSNLNKHIKTSQKCKNKFEESIKNTTNNIISNTQNIGIQNNAESINIINNININLKSLRGFEEEWNTSNITKEMRKNLLLSDTRFTNTLKNILENDENLNVILKDESTGIVYKLNNNEYEAMHIKDILDISMDKIYKHLRNFLEETINIDNKNIINEIDKKYYTYKKDLKIKNDVNNYLADIFNENKNKSIEKFIETLEEKECNELIDNTI